MSKKIPMAIPIIESSVQGANGLLYHNSRIKTFYRRPNIDNGKWYHGKIIEILTNNQCRISYDEGFEVVGGANVVFLETNNQIKVKVDKVKKVKKKNCVDALRVYRSDKKTNQL